VALGSFLLSPGIARRPCLPSPLSQGRLGTYAFIHIRSYPLIHQGQLAGPYPDAHPTATVPWGEDAAGRDALSIWHRPGRIAVVWVRPTDIRGLVNTGALALHATQSLPWLRPDTTQTWLLDPLSMGLAARPGGHSYRRGHGAPGVNSDGDVVPAMQQHNRNRGLSLDGDRCTR
jgi:hypothetical protein